MDKRQQLGRQGEERAVDYLIAKGYTIVARNWRCSAGEMDIVAQHQERLIFVEVRTRWGRRFGTAAESVTPAKQSRLIAVAQTYLQTMTTETPSWQIDVITVQVTADHLAMRHIENAVGW